MKSPRYSAQYPSPTASMVTVGDMVQAQYAGSDPRRPTYERARRMWPTPTSADAHGGPGCSGREGGLNLRTAASLEEDADGQLNPSWMEWLMGWPPGWTGELPLSAERVLAWRERAVAGTLWDEEPPGVPRTERNIPNRTSRIEAVGNGQVPTCAARAFLILTEAEGKLREALDDRAPSPWDW